MEKKNNIEITTIDEYNEMLNERKKWSEEKFDEAQEGDLRYFKVFHGLSTRLSQSKLSGNTILVYLCLHEFAHSKTGELFIPNERITEKTKIKGSTLSDCLNSLEKNGLIKRVMIEKENGRYVRKMILLPYI